MRCRPLISSVGLALVIASGPGAARADDSKLDKEGVTASRRGAIAGRNKLCCGYPLSEVRGFKYTYYWLARQQRHFDRFDEIALYTPQGWFLGAFTQEFVDELKMEGSGILADGRVINYAGRCRWGVGTCFETLDPRTHPHGRGAGRRPLIPWQSVAVDRLLIPIGDTLYAPEFDGMPLPDGSFHDGCFRADDTGSAIKRRLIDIFVAELEHFRWVNHAMWFDRYFTPHIEAPRCDHLRDAPE